jgi:hypothetical protein
VAPHDHEDRLGRFFLQKALPEDEKVMIVVAGRVPPVKVGRDLEEARIPYRAGILDPERRQEADQVVIVCTEGKGHPPHRISHQRFQRPPVVEDFGCRDVGGNPFQVVVVDGVDGDFMIPVQGGDFGGANPARPVQRSRIEVKRAPDAVSVEHLDQTPIVDGTVIIAEGQRPPSPLREEAELNPHRTPWHSGILPPPFSPAYP